jgi:hypothetical protein
MVAWDLDEVVEEITAYVQAHPGAGDTLAGVMGWWVPSRSAEIVEAALDLLVSRGILCTRTLPSGEPYYFGAVAEAPQEFEE